MDEKELQELKLEEIMREFHEDHEDPATEDILQDVPEETPEIDREVTPEKPAEATVNAERQELTDEELTDSEVSVEDILGNILSDEDPQEKREEDLDEDLKFNIPAPGRPQAVEEVIEDTEDLPEAADAEQNMTGDTVRLDVPTVKRKLSGDTIRLDGIAKELPKAKVRGTVQTDMDATQVLDIPQKEEPFSEHWEPEYEQPMGEYVPPQPIVFKPRSRLRELKKDLIAGPEKRYYEISEMGFGKLQMAIFFSFVVSIIAITATVIYAMGMVSPERMRLMVFGQFFTMLVSGLLGVNLMMDGAASLFHGKFTLNTMLLFTYIACCVDGVFCLIELKVPCCAAFCIQVTMALLSSQEQRRTEISQMDTMRKANRLDGVAICRDYMEDKPGLLRKEAQVSEFMDHYNDQSDYEKILNIYALSALAASVAIAVLAGVFHDVYVAFRVLAVTLLAAMPATAFITLTRPFAVLEGRLHGLGTVLCGWKSVKKLSEKAIFPLTHEDIYPAGSVRLNGVKFYGSRKPDQVVAYCTAVVAADDGGLAPVFKQVLDSRNGYHYDALNLKVYDGGIGAEVEEEPVLVGNQAFLKKMGVDVPDGIRINNAVCISIDGEFSGLFAVTFDNVRSSSVGVTTLCNYRSLLPVLVSADFVLSSQFLQTRFGIKPKKILMPDQSVRQQLRQKQLDDDARSLLLTTRPGLASVAFGITGAKSLQTAAVLGVAIHMIGGILGLAMMAALVVLGALNLLTPVNMFLYQMVWMIPGFLITEWTRSV